MNTITKTLEKPVEEKIAPFENKETIRDLISVADDLIGAHSEWCYKIEAIRCLLLAHGSYDFKFIIQMITPLINNLRDDIWSSQEMEGLIESNMKLEQMKESSKAHKQQPLAGLFDSIPTYAKKLPVRGESLSILRIIVKAYRYFLFAPAVLLFWFVLAGGFIDFALI